MHLSAYEDAVRDLKLKMAADRTPQFFCAGSASHSNKCYKPILHREYLTVWTSKLKDAIINVYDDRLKFRDVITFIHPIAQ